MRNHFYAAQMIYEFNIANFFKISIFVFENKKYVVKFNLRNNDR